MKHYCMNCSHLQGYVGEIQTFIYCERCGAQINADGSCSYDGTKEGFEQSRENERFYDSGYGDRGKWERNGKPCGRW